MANPALQKLLDKKAQLEAQIKAHADRERQQQRKDDTRRKVIAGSLALNHMEKNPNDPFSKKLHLLLDEYVTRPAERELLNLPPLPDTTNPTANDTGSKDGSLKTEFQK